MKSAEIKEVRAYIQKADLKNAIDKFLGYTEKNAELHEQIMLYAAQFNDISKRIRMGVVDSSEASIQKNRITYALLELLGEISSVQYKVFISYNHKDAAIANKLKEQLVKEGIDVTIDSEAMQAGEDIKGFIEKCIRDTDITLSIVSKNSLLSAWVAMETLNTFGLQLGAIQKKFIPCYIEPDFFDHAFTDNALVQINAKIAELAEIIQKRLSSGQDSLDVNNEYSRLIKLRNSLAEIVGKLRNSLCIDISETQYASSFPKIVAAIKE